MAVIIGCGVVYIIDKKISRIAVNLPSVNVPKPNIYVNLNNEDMHIHNDNVTEMTSEEAMVIDKRINIDTAFKLLEKKNKEIEEMSTFEKNKSEPGTNNTKEKQESTTDNTTKTESSEPEKETPKFVPMKINRPEKPKETSKPASKDVTLSRIDDEASIELSEVEINATNQVDHKPPVIRSPESNSKDRGFFIKGYNSSTYVN